jgi:hypothetical protein
MGLHSVRSEAAKVLGTTVFGAKVVRIAGNYDWSTACARRLRTSITGAS